MRYFCGYKFKTESARADLFKLREEKVNCNIMHCKKLVEIATITRAYLFGEQSFFR